MMRSRAYQLCHILLDGQTQLEKGNSVATIFRFRATKGFIGDNQPLNYTKK